LTRVLIPKKTYLHAVGNAENTIIEGILGTGTDHLGNNALRCIVIVAGGAGTEIKGFTFRNGATKNVDGTESGSGGGVLSYPADAYIVDCVISNCAAFKGGGIYGGTAVRSFFYKNSARGPTSGNSGSAANNANLFCCVIDSCSGSRDGDLNAALSESIPVNCTIVNCKTGIFISNNSKNKKQAYNCVFSGIAGNDKAGYAVLNKCTTTASQGAYQLIGPGVGDYRILSTIGGETLECAATQAATTLKLPEEYRAVDFAGNFFPQSGNCLPGAVQVVATAKGGAIQAKSGNLIVDGKILRSGSYLFAEAWPTQFHVAAAVPAGKHLWAFARDIANGGRVFPQLDNTALIMPSPDVTNVTTTEPVFAGSAYYVNPDPQIGSDENNGLSETTPFLTLQKAVDKCSGIDSISECAVIYAAEGDYNQGGKTIASSQPSYSQLTNRLCIATGKRFVRIVGAGAGKSFISGAPDPVTGGNGPGAIRPIGVFSHDTAVQGFTIRNGYVNSASGKEFDNISAVLGRNVDFSFNNNMLTITDCDITENTAHGSSGAVALYANLQRCRIYGNTGGSYVLPTNSKATSLLIYDNAVDDNKSILAGCLIANSTIQAGSNVNLQNAGNATVYVSILDGGKSLPVSGKIYGSLLNNSSDGSINEENEAVYADPCFIDPENGDFGVYAVSKALAAGGIPTVDNWGTNWWKLASSGDINGKRILFNASKPLAGAVSKVVPLSGAFVSAPNGGLSVGSGVINLDEGENVTVNIGEGLRPAIGFTANGVTNIFTADSSFVVTSADSFYIEPIYTCDWYVDAANGDDDNLGFTPFTAKKTFKSLIENCDIAAGDTIHAAEGTYEEGEMIISGDKVGSRVIVPAGVTVVADGRVEKTVIKGKAATIDPSEYGLGSNAVRCVALNVNSKISGFTLTGGHTGRHGNSNKNVENLGAGVWGVGNDVKAGIVENCIISNNFAFRGGGAAYTTVVKCRVFNNRGCDSEGGGSGAYRCNVYGSIFALNNGNYCVMYSTPVIGTTIADGNGTTYALYNSDGCIIRNCILNCGVRMKSKNAKAYYSFFKENPKVDEGVALLAEGSSVVGAGNLKFFNGYYPRIGENAAVDNGNIAYHNSEICGDTDLNGSPRVANGTIDAGALEADWREVYAKTLTGGGSYLKVENASPNVTLAEDAPLTLNAGQTLDAVLSGKGGRSIRYQVAFRVTGSGTLRIVVGDKEETYTSDDGDVMLNFLSAAQKLALAFAYIGGEDDDGAAQIFSISRQLGLWMTIR
jgi:hypothetical protein